MIGGLVAGTNYSIDVIASNSAGNSGPSAMKPIPPGNAGSPPTNVSATSESSGKVTVSGHPRLHWARDSSRGTRLRHSRVQRHLLAHTRPNAPRIPQRRRHVLTVASR